MRFVAVVAGIAVFAYLVDYAAHQQAASAAGLSERGIHQRSLASAPNTVGGENGQLSRPRSESPFVSAANVTAITAIRSVFGARAPAAIRVARCETGGTMNVRAVGRAGERGLFQIHPVHFSWAQPARLFDPVWNSRVAYRLSRGGTNWRPWTCRP